MSKGNLPIPSDAVSPSGVVAQARLVSGTGRRRPFDAYDLGDRTPEGWVISSIEARGPEYIIFRAKDDKEYFRCEYEPVDWLQTPLRELGRYRSEASVKLLGTYNWRFSKILCECLVTAVRAGKSGSEVDHFSAARAFLDEWAPVRRIYGTGRGFTVYQNKKGELSYETSEGAHETACKSQVQLIESLAGNLPKENREHLRDLLGGALSSALRTEKTEDALRLFQPAREYVANVSDALAKSEYLTYSAASGAGLIVGTLLLLYLYFPQSLESYLVLGMVGGVTGALISVAQRNQSIQLNTIVPHRHLAVQGVVRVLLGGVFGVLALVLCKANLAFGMFKDQTEALFILAVVGGVSERLVPDVLSRLGAAAAQEKGKGRQGEPKPKANG